MYGMLFNAKNRNSISCHSNYPPHSTWGLRQCTLGSACADRRGTQGEDRDSPKKKRSGHLHSAQRHAGLAGDSPGTIHLRPAKPLTQARLDPNGPSSLTLTHTHTHTAESCYMSTNLITRRRRDPILPVGQLLTFRGCGRSPAMPRGHTPCGLSRKRAGWPRWAWMSHDIIRSHIPAFRSR